MGFDLFYLKKRNITPKTEGSFWKLSKTLIRVIILIFIYIFFALLKKGWKFISHVFLCLIHFEWFMESLPFCSSGGWQSRGGTSAGAGDLGDAVRFGCGLAAGRGETPRPSPEKGSSGTDNVVKRIIYWTGKTFQVVELRPREQAIRIVFP